MSASGDRSGGAGRLAGFAWCSYDWANSGFPTVIMTFVYGLYFAKAVAPSEVQGTSLWAFAVGASGLAVAVASPVLGAIADAAGRAKPWVGVFTVLCIAATLLLWTVTPENRWVVVALIAVAVANFAFEMGTVFYNAMLPRIAPPGMIGRLSGWGWGVGYIGGLGCLVACLLLLIRPDPPLFGLDKASAEPVRATAILVALWFGLFAVPFFALVPDAPSRERLSAATAVRSGLRSLVATFGHVRKFRNVALYLFAHMVYADGLNTLFTIGGVYVGVTFGMDFDEILIFAIAMNVFAGIGAFAFGWIDDRIGPKPTIVIALLALAAIGIGLILIGTDPWAGLASALADGIRPASPGLADAVMNEKTWLWGLAMPLGIFLGPAQSASRSLMARLAPPDLTAEFFGLYALSGKATAFVGPFVYGLVTGITGNQRFGLATIIVFILAGLALLLPVRAPGRSQRTDPT